jgi:hypothetical protein
VCPTGSESVTRRRVFRIVSRAEARAAVAAAKVAAVAKAARVASPAVVVRVALAQVRVVVRAAVVVRAVAYRLHLFQLIKFDGLPHTHRFDASRS